MKDLIIEAICSPHELELLYRKKPKEFTRSFPEAFAVNPDSIALMVWHERLFLEDKTSNRLRSRDLVITIVLSIIAGTLVKLPHFFPQLDEEMFFSRNLAGIVFGALIAYFCLQKLCSAKTVILISGFLFGGLVYLNLLPEKPDSQTIVLACLHIPFFFWSLLGLAFLGGAWKNLPGRMDYIRFNGELLIYTTIVLIGGMVLTGITLNLFGLIDLDIEDWYTKNVVVYGATASPIVATLLVEKGIGSNFRLSPLLAKVFSPLFLATVVAYLLAMILMRKSPFTDRDFLIAFNVLLVVVLGLCVFSISERDQKDSSRVVDLVNVGLVSVTLMIDIVALMAILFRLTSYGFTPNRLAVLGANLLAFCHLSGILFFYSRFIRRKTGIEQLDKWIVAYLPAYITWSIVVAIGFPLIFWFR